MGVKSLFRSGTYQLSPEESSQFRREIKAGDIKRLIFFSKVCMFSFLVLLILDYYIFNQQLKGFYVPVDASFLSVSIVVFLFFYFTRKTYSNALERIKSWLLFLFPCMLIVWGAIIASVEQELTLNIITFYFVLFIVGMMLDNSLVKLFLYFILTMATYYVVSQRLGTPIRTETFVLFSLGYVIMIPFSIYFTYLRHQSLVAQIKSKTINNELEYEVQKRTRELRMLNEDLELEIANRKMSEIKLRDALSMAEQNDKLKSEFLANISHEIRTPLNAILGFTQMMTEDAIPPPQKKIFQRLVENNTMYLLSTIDDIFDISMIRSNQLNAICQLFHVNQFIDDIAYDAPGYLSKHEREGEVQFKVNKQVSNSLRLNSDSYLLKKAMSRLMDNAFKFTLKGEIELGVVLDGNALEFYVRDTGIGIPESDQTKILNPFVQGDGSFARGFGGAGLGLAIVDGVCSTLQCKLLFSSKAEKGSTFVVRFDHFFLVDY
jgi:signal transduction histidine kinase